MSFIEYLHVLYYAWVKGELLWSLSLFYVYITLWVLSSSKIGQMAFGLTIFLFLMMTKQMELLYINMKETSNEALPKHMHITNMKYKFYVIIKHMDMIFWSKHYALHLCIQEYRYIKEYAQMYFLQPSIPSMLQKGGRLLAQKTITLVLMMIHSCRFSTNDLVFIKFQIFNQDLSRCLASIKDSKSSFEASMCWFKSSHFKISWSTQ